MKLSDMLTSQWKNDDICNFHKLKWPGTAVTYMQCQQFMIALFLVKISIRLDKNVMENLKEDHSFINAYWSKSYTQISQVIQYLTSTNLFKRHGKHEDQCPNLKLISHYLWAYLWFHISGHCACTWISPKRKTIWKNTPLPCHFSVTRNQFIIIIIIIIISHSVLQHVFQCVTIF